MVGLIIKLHTWSISTQLYVVFDDMFTTIYSAHNEEVLPKICTNMITNPNDCLNFSLDKDTKPTFSGEWFSPE